MKYKIIKRQSKSLKVTKPIDNLNGKYVPESTSVETREWYEAKRKGRIFGFWHKIGHECDWWDGSIFKHTTKTLEEMKNYVRDWHEVNYGNDCKCEIIESFEL